MSYLLDTCVLSELRKPAPDPNVTAWVEAADESRLFISVIVLGEIQKGIAKLEDARRSQALQLWLEQDLRGRFEGRILPVDAAVALEWGVLQGAGAKSGLSLPVIDSLIGATAVCHNLTLVTRNTADFERMPVRLFNPWMKD
ncbi:MAG: type II toxin-antitoxin system VapC family toxin [Methylococcus sp.]|nr:type II toxin-antitoxin system VapC family toxin [Methylococcus sp.]